MKRWIYNILLVICILVMVFAGSKILIKNHEYKAAEDEYESIRKTAEKQDTSEEQDTIDFQKLKEINPDIVAWIKIPGTEIDYPIVQGKDNEEYLHNTFSGESNSSGAIFLDYQCAGDFSSANSIIYGHHMRNGSMFADLLKLRDTEFLKKHNDIYMYLPDKTLHLKVFAGYAARAETIPVVFENDECKDEYLTEIQNRSDILCEESISPERIYTFVTCSYEGTDYRTYIYAMEQ